MACGIQRGQRIHHSNRSEQRPRSRQTVTAEKQSNAKWQSIYPGIAVSVTVEGPYQNVRHFVRDVEISRQFLIINAVELERVTQSGLAQEQAVGFQPQPPLGRGTTAPQSFGRQQCHAGEFAC